MQDRAILMSVFFGLVAFAVRPGVGAGSIPIQDQVVGTEQQENQMGASTHQLTSTPSNVNANAPYAESGLKGDDDDDDNQVPEMSLRKPKKWNKVKGSKNKKETAGSTWCGSRRRCPADTKCVKSKCTKAEVPTEEPYTGPDESLGLQCGEDMKCVQPQKQPATTIKVQWVSFDVKFSYVIYGGKCGSESEISRQEDVLVTPTSPATVNVDSTGPGKCIRVEFSNCIAMGSLKDCKIFIRLVVPTA